MPDRIVRALIQSPHRFEFFQAVRLLERAGRGGVRIGYTGPPEKEAIRLKVSPSLVSQRAELLEIQSPDKSPDRRYHLITAMTGLSGVASPLPSYMIRRVLMDDVTSEGDGVLRAFLDIFHHRILSLAYRARSKYRWALGYEPDASSGLGPRVVSLLEVSQIWHAYFWPPEEDESLGVLPLILGRLFIRRVRSAEGLRTVLRFFLQGAGVRIDQCTFRRCPIPEAAQSYFKPGHRLLLGRNTLVGTHAADRRGMFRIRIGPLPYDRYVSLLPGTKRALFNRLCALVEAYLPAPLEFDIQLVLDRDHAIRLQARLGEGRSLGRNTGFFSRRPEDVSLILPSAAGHREPLG